VQLISKVIAQVDKTARDISAFSDLFHTKCSAVSHTLLTLLLSNGVGTNFGVGVEEARPEGPRAGMGSWGGDSQPLSTN